MSKIMEEMKILEKEMKESTIRAERLIQDTLKLIKDSKVINPPNSKLNSSSICDTNPNPSNLATKPDKRDSKSESIPPRSNLESQTKQRPIHPSRCYHCGYQGHFQSNCRYNNIRNRDKKRRLGDLFKNSYNDSKPQSHFYRFDNNTFCYNCIRLGHKAKNCRNKTRGWRVKSNLDNNSKDKIYTIKIDSNSENVNNERIDQYENKNKNPYSKNKNKNNNNNLNNGNVAVLSINENVDSGLNNKGTKNGMKCKEVSEINNGEKTKQKNKAKSSADPKLNAHPKMNNNPKVDPKLNVNPNSKFDPKLNNNSKLNTNNDLNNLEKIIGDKDNIDLNKNYNNINNVTRNHAHIFYPDLCEIILRDK